MVGGIGILAVKILTFLGLLLLCILVLLVLVLLTLAFVPLRYRARARREEAADGTWDVEGDVHLSWLFGVLTGEISYPHKPFLTLKILGIPLRRRGKRDKPEGGTLEEAKASAEAGSSTEADSSTEATPSSVREEEDRKEPPSEDHLTGWEKIEYTILDLCDKINGFHAKLEGLCSKIVSYIRLLRAEETQTLLEKIGRYGRRMGYSLLPKELSGHLVFGTGDPASTGYLWACMVMALAGRFEKLHIEPDFDHALVEGCLHVKGRIYGMVVLINGLPIVLAPELGAVRRRMKNGGMKDAR